MRNCTRVDKIVISDIMKIVLDELLNVKNEQVIRHDFVAGWNRSIRLLTFFSRSGYMKTDGTAEVFWTFRKFQKQYLQNFWRK